MLHITFRSNIASVPLAPCSRAPEGCLKPKASLDHPKCLQLWTPNIFKIRYSQCIFFSFIPIIKDTFMHVVFETFWPEGISSHILLRTFTQHIIQKKPH